MQHIPFLWFDYVLFIFMVSLSAIIGIYFGFFEKQNTTKEYLHGGKKMKVFPVAMSLAASSVSGVALLGVPAEIYMYGTQYSMMVVSTIFMGCAVNFIYLPVFYKLQITSIFEYLEMRFDKGIRRVVSGLTTFSYIIGLPIIIYAPSLAFNQVTGFSLHMTALCMSLFCIFYTTIGGVKAVIWIDTFQFLITLSTFFCLLIVGTISVGGLSVIWERARQGDRIEFFNMDLDPTTRSTFWSVVIGSFTIWTFFTGINQGVVQRFLAVPTYKGAQKALIVFIVFTIITKIIGSFSGLIAYAKYYDCDPFTAGFMKKPDQIIPFFVMDVGRQIPGLGGLFVAGLFTTALSTLSTMLNALGGTTYVDFVKPFMPVDITERRASNIMKLTTLIIGLVCTGLIFVVERLGTILQLVMTVIGITGGPIIGTFTTGMLLPTINRKGAMSGLLCSVIFMLIVAVGNQRLIWNGTIKTLHKPLYTYGCNISSTTTTTTDNSIDVHDITSYSEEEPFWLFRISFYYYILMGATSTIIIDLIVSRLSRNKNDLPVNPDLFCPCIYRFLPESLFETRYSCVEEKMLKLETK